MSDYILTEGHLFANLLKRIFERYISHEISRIAIVIQSRLIRTRTTGIENVLGARAKIRNTAGESSTASFVAQYEIEEHRYSILVEYKSKRDTSKTCEAV
jgi:hypothetical protein